MNDDFDRWLELELDHSLAAVTREPAPPRVAGAGPRWRPGMILRPVVAAAGAKALMGGAAAVLAAGALAGVAVTHHSAPPAHPTPGISAPSGTPPRAHSGDSSDPSASPAAGGQNDQHGQGDQRGHGQGDGGDKGNGEAKGNGPHPTPANTPNGVSGNGNGNNGEGDRGNSGAAHSPGPNSSPQG